MLGLEQEEYARAQVSLILIPHQLYTRKIFGTYTKSRNLSNNFFTTLSGLLWAFENRWPERTAALIALQV